MDRDWWRFNGDRFLHHPNREFHINRDIAADANNHMFLDGFLEATVFDEHGVLTRLDKIKDVTAIVIRLAADFDTSIDVA